MTTTQLDLVGTAEIAQIMGVSRQRVHQLRSSFPEPAAYLQAAGPVWHRAEIVRHLEERSKAKKAAPVKKAAATKAAEAPQAAPEPPKAAKATNGAKKAPVANKAAPVKKAAAPAKQLERREVEPILKGGKK